MSFPIPGWLSRQRIVLGAGLDVSFEVQAFGGWATRVDLEIQLAADFADMFDVRGMTPRQRPVLPRAQGRPRSDVTFGATAPTVNRFDPKSRASPSPSAAEAAMVKQASDDVAIPVKLTFTLDLAGGSIRIVQLR